MTNEDSVIVRNFRAIKAGNDTRELVATFRDNVLANIDAELQGLKSELLKIEEVDSKEYRQVHFRARVLAELFDQISVIINTGEQAKAEAEHEQGENGDG